MMHLQRRAPGFRFVSEESPSPPAICGRIPACDWPAIPTDAGAQSLALLFQLERSQWLSPGDLRTAQHRQLNVLVDEARQRIPAWGDRLRAAGVEPGTNLDAVALSRIPVLPAGMCNGSDIRFAMTDSGRSTEAFTRAKRQALPGCR